MYMGALELYLHHLLLGGLFINILATNEPGALRGAI